MDLPYNLDTEKQVLANMLTNSTSLTEALSRLSPDDFYDNKNKLIFTAILDLVNDKTSKSVDAVSVIDKLSSNGQLEVAGDAVYISEIVSSYRDILNSTFYINAVEERSALRQLILYSDNVCKNWQKNSEGDYSNYISKIEQDITKITKKRRIEDFISVDSAFDQYKKRITSLREGKGQNEAITTGYIGLDSVLLGFKPGEVTILAARPSVGKSALALNILTRAAERSKKACVFFSLEMGIDSIVNRLLSCKSGIDQKKIMTGKFNKAEEIELNKAMIDLGRYQIFIDETSAIKVSQMRAKLTKLQQTYDLGLVVVDYIGLISPDVRSKKNDNRALELGEISAALRSLAKDFKVPVLALSQLSRGIEQRADAEPKLSDLRESGNIEQDADVVMFIHRPDYGKVKKDDNGEDKDKNKEAEQENKPKSFNSAVKLMIKKNRNGELANIDFMFQMNIGRFVEIDKNR